MKVTLFLFVDKLPFLVDFIKALVFILDFLLVTCGHEASKINTYSQIKIVMSLISTQAW